MNRTTVVVATLLTAGCGAQLKVHRVTPGSTSATGIYFALPRTVVVVKGVEKVTTSTPPTPECAELAKNAGLAPYTAGSKGPELGDLALETRSEPDAQQLFLLQPSSTPVSSAELDVELSELQTLSSGKSAAQGEGLTVTARVLNIAGSVVGTIVKAVFTAGAGVQSVEKTKGDFDDDKVPDKEDRCPNVVGSPAFQGCPSVAHLKCALALAGLFDLKDKHTQLAAFATNAVAPHDKDIYTAALAEMQSLERQHLEVLIGTKKVVSTPFECELAPSKAQETIALDAAACRGTSPKGLAVEIDAVSVFGAPPAPATAGQGDPPGVPYRIPARGVITLRNGKGIEATLRKPIAQLGALAYLPTAELATHNEFKLSSETGALLSFAGKRESQAASVAKDLGEAAGTAGTAFDSFVKGRAGAQAQAEQAELDTLERRQKKLELEKKIRELESAAESQNQ